MALPGYSPQAADRKPPAATTHVAVGPLALDVPANWRRREGPADDNPHFDAPAEALGLGPTVAISVEEAGEDSVAPGITEQSREWRDINGWRVQVRQWVSEEDGTRGVTIIPDKVTSGKVYQVVGFMPQTVWKARSAELWRVIGTLRVTAAGDATGPTQAGASLGPVRRYDFGNKLAVTNGPTAAYALKFDKAVLLRSIRTYHWNNGRGATPGTIALRDAMGSMLGPWPAQGSPGQGGVSDAYWQANPGVVLPAGTYTIVTSNDRTWSTNREAGGRGFFTVEWQESLANPAPDSTATTASPGGAPDTATDNTKPTANPTTTETKISDAQSEGMLFAGDLGQRWSKLSVAGGDFDKFARLTKGQLVVTVPGGNGWGKTGIRSNEPLVTLPTTTANVVTRLDIALDGARSDNFVVALVPTRKQRDDEWSAHHVRLGIAHTEGTSPALVLWIDQQEAGRLQLPATGIEQLALEIRPDGVVLVSDVSGKALLQGTSNGDIDRGGYHVFALAHAPTANLPAALALKSIRVTKVAFTSPSEGPRYLQAGQTQRQVLFGGRLLGRNWRPYSAQGGDYAKHARIEGGALIVDAPKGSGWAKSGIYSDGPLLWFDGEGDNATARIEFDFDGTRTDGFVVALAALSNLPGNEPSNPRFVVHWRRVGNAAKVSVLRDYDVVKQIDVPSSAAPSTLALRLTRGKIEVVEPQWALQPFDWPEIRAGQGLHVYAYGQANEPDATARMALRQIVVERNAGAPTIEAKPANGVAPLPLTPMFNGELGTAWEEASVNGAEFAKHGRRERGLVAAEFPDKLYSWGKTGIVSNASVLNLDERALVTPYRLRLKFVPQRTSGAQIVFNGDKRQDMWAGHRASVALIKHGSGRFEGSWLLSVESDGYRQWSRPIDAGWMDKNWDGTLEIEAGERWLTARVPGGTFVRGTNLPLYKTDQLHMAVYAHPAEERGGARMGLASIAGQWLLPPNVSKIDRWTYVDNDKFDSKGFLDDLAKSAGVASTGEASGGPGSTAADAGPGNAGEAPSLLSIAAGKQAVYKSTSTPIYMVVKFGTDALDATCAAADGRSMRRFSGKTNAGSDDALMGAADFSEGIKSSASGTLDYRFDRDGRRASTLWRAADGTELLVQWVRVADVGATEPLQPESMAPTGNQETRP